MNDTRESNALSVDEFRSLSGSFVRKALCGLSTKVELAFAKKLDFILRMPNGESWGIVYQCYRTLRESLQRTFEAKNQSALQKVCFANGLVPVFACTIVTSDEPSKLHVIAIKLDDLISMTNSGGVRWLCYSDKRGIILHFNSNKGYMKEIKSNPHVFYAAYTL